MLEIPTDFDPAADAALDAALDQSRLLLMGETHGVEENPAIICTLFRRYGFSALALEWPADTDLDTPTLSMDGRVTPRHFELLEELRRDGSLKELILFSASGDGTWSGRDRAMAALLLGRRRPDFRTLVFAGNLHTPTRAHRHGQPMGQHIAAAVPGVATGRVRYFGGHYYNFGVKRFRPGSWTGPSRARFHFEDGEFVFELPLAHAAAAPQWLDSPPRAESS